MRLPASAIKRCFMSFGRDEAPTSKRSSTAVETLLTFCPPGPEARTKRSSSSRSSMAMVSVTRMRPGARAAVQRFHKQREP
jgi:hypothetical protein